MLLPALAALVLAGCAYGLRSDPVQVTVAGVDALPGAFSRPEPAGAGNASPLSR